MAVRVDQRRALKLLASSPDGCPMAIMARGFKNVMLNALVREGLATTTPGNGRADKQRSIEVVRMMITDAGRLALGLSLERKGGAWPAFGVPC
jgi:hypothetical protein